MTLGLSAGCEEKAAHIAPMPPPTVTVSLPIERDVYEYIDFTGYTDAVKSVEVRARVTGYLDRVCFQEGADVKAGDLLFEIDPRPFQAKYDQELARIQLCEANLRYATAELNRSKQLIGDRAVSQSDYDKDVASQAQAVASLAAAKASAAEAKLNLGFTKLYSPIDGEISRTQITNGNLVQADQTLLTTVVSVDPMYVYFDADEQTILRVQQDVREGKIKTSETDKIPVWMGLDTETGFPHEGYLDFIENRFNTGTGTIRVRGVFANPKPARGSRILKPGNNANIRLIIGRPTKGIWIAERAIGVDQGQKYVLVVNKKNEVEYRRVTLGWLEGQLRVICSGLQADDRVIIEGVQRVRPGMTVAPKLVPLETFVGDGAAKTKAETPEKAERKPTEKPQKQAGKAKQAGKKR